MESFKFRCWARAVAVIDMIILALQTVLMLVVVIMLIEEISMRSYPNVIPSDDEQDEEKNHDDDEEALSSGEAQTLGLVTVVVIIITLAIVGVMVYAAAKLFAASTTTRDPEKALDHAIYWRRVAIGSMVMLCIASVRRLNMFGFIFVILWRVPSLFVVGSFISALEGFITEQSGGIDLPTVPAEEV